MKKSCAALALTVGASLACTSPKIVKLDFLEDVSLSSTTRPISDPYVIAGELATAQSCESDGTLDVQQLIAYAQGEHDALIQVTIERRLIQSYSTFSGGLGSTRSGQTLVSQDVCYQVSGYPVNFLSPSGAAEPAPATLPSPAPATEEG
jgi:hypothetical protein